ncbi:hypothetical protein ACFWF7_02025 [Nocardia sp. NPDC060256]|uniref:hypothetical protein n=1 Tax=unclassified Nocardia TaxID=2637762 RepID=UPI0036698557
MTVSEPQQLIADSLIFGNILITRTGDTVTTRLESDESTTVTISRTGPRIRKNIPIGTRDPNFLTTRVNDREIKVVPGSGKILKRTYRIIVEDDDRILSFRPTGIDTCMFIKGKPHEIEKHFGDLTADVDGTIEVLWAVPQHVKLVNKTVEPPEPTVEELLIGYALAAAFGTGALSLSSIIMGLVSAALPG